MNKIKCTITPNIPIYGILAGPIRKKTDLELSREQIIRCINNNAVITTNIEGKSVRININNASDIIEKALSKGISKQVNNDTKVDEPADEPKNETPIAPEPVKVEEPKKEEPVKEEKKEEVPVAPAPAQEEVKKDNKPFDKKKNKQDKRNNNNNDSKVYTEQEAEKVLSDTLEEIEIQEMIDNDKK